MSRIERLRHVPLGAWLVLAVVIASLAAIVIAAPPAMWESLARADWTHVAGVIGLVSTALALAVSRVRAAWQGATIDPGLVPGARPRPWERPGYDDEDPTPALTPRAMDRRDRLPGDAPRPRSSRDGSASPTLLAGILTAVLVAIAALASGCGASALRVHATVASTAGATIDTWCQEEVERRLAELDAAERAHEYREDAAAAVAEVRARYEPTLGACGVAKGVHDGWVSGIALGAAGAPWDPVDAARRFARPLAEIWVGIARATAGGDHPLPAPPPELVTIADAIAPREDEDR